MKAEFKDESLVIVPENHEEIEKFNRLFPEQFMRNSRYFNVKQFVDMFGNPEPNRPYLMINGFEPGEERVRRNSRKGSDTAEAAATV